MRSLHGGRNGNDQAEGEEVTDTQCIALIAAILATAEPQDKGSKLFIDRAIDLLLQSKHREKFVERMIADIEFKS